MNLRQLREETGKTTLVVPGSQVVVVFGPKGGVGKTLISACLACVSSMKANRKTLLLDMDLDSGDLSVHLDLPEGRSIADLVPYCHDLRAEQISKFVSRHEASGADVVLAPPRPELSELIRPEQVAALIEGARRQYQSIIIDTPPALDCDMVYECLERSDSQVLVVTQDLACLKQSRTALELIKRLGHSVDDRTLVAINHYRDRSILTKPKIVEFLGIKRVTTISEDRDVVDRSVLDGQPVVISAQNSQVSRDIMALATDLFAIPSDEPDKRSRFGFRLFEKRRLL